MHARISKRSARAAAALAVVAAALVAATVGNTAATRQPPAAPANFKSVLSQIKGLKVKDREAKLHQLAAAEGQLNIYTSLSSTITGAVTKAWADKYPDVKLNLYRASSEDVTARVLAERNAGTSGADVIETNGTNMLIFQHMKNVLVPYKQSPLRAKIPKAYQFDTFTADRLEKFVVAWNTNAVSSPPRSFSDLTNPKWKGKLALEPTDVDWFAALYTYFTKTRKPHMKPAAADRM